ncbi:head-tail connector protein [Alkanindiges illinoisensis]|uniref:head-tail connector protein n=1 Tax=Alkanindiges illinoisensis TaxID=197183 RepID=UPI00047D6FE1|nr:head-tail connector protein [Alkanindiges illinoisensis]
MALTTLERVKEWLKLQAVAVDDELLQRLIDAASAFVEKWLGFTVLRHEVVRWMDGNGKDELVLTDPHILAINSITIDGRLIPAGQYRHADWWLILDCACFSRGRRNICIKYDIGFDTVPADIENAVIDLVALGYKEKDRIGLQSKTLAGETISYFTGVFSERSKMVLQQYKRVVPG